MYTIYNTFNFFMMAFDSPLFTKLAHINPEIYINYTTTILLYSSIVPIKVYSNADTMKEDMIKDNHKKIGIYRWVNNITGETYIGSSVDLYRRIRLYYNYNYISDLTKNRSRIHAGLLKYGYSNFSFEVLEYCKKDVVLEREQFYLDTLNPVLNILKVAGSNLGQIQREESILKRVNAFADNKKTREALKALESIENLKENKSPINFPSPGSTRPLEIIELMRKNHSRSKVIYEYKSDKITLIAKYDSLRQAQEVTGLTREYIVRCIKADKLAHNSSWYSFTELK